ncbi:MAG: M23 family metallopeptidase [Ginsengibacter sp.]
MSPKKEKTTVLFVNKDAQGIKPMQISSKLILNWKKYLLALFLLFAGLIGVIVFLTSNNIQQIQSQEVLSQKLQLMHLTIEKLDTATIRKKFTDIDKELFTINGYLKARGIKSPIKGPEGGEEDNDLISTAEISEFYENYLHRLIYNISYTPLGYPFPGDITSTFGHRENPFTGENVETHKGVDIRAPMGAPVRAMAKGEVEFAGLKGGFGNCIMLKHANGFETLYGHLSKILVNVGQQIEIGQQIGRVGSTGRSTGPHLHYEVHKNGEKIDPKNFLTLN